jgi:hypothetical protein
MWVRRVPSPCELATLAETWLRVHRLPTNGVWMATGQSLAWVDVVTRPQSRIQMYAYWANRRGSERRDVARLCLDALERCLTVGASMIPADPPQCLCRSDRRFANVLARPDGCLGLVDWLEHIEGESTTHIVHLDCAMFACPLGRISVPRVRERCNPPSR